MSILGISNLGGPNSRKVEKEKLTLSIKITSVTLFSKLNIESEHFNAVNRTKNYRSTLIFFVSPPILR